MTYDSQVPVLPHARFELDRRRQLSKWPHIWDLLDGVKDPEIPVLSIWELGVLQDVRLFDRDAVQVVEVTITPTYSGCPALSMMAQDIQSVLNANGFAVVEIATRLAPAWTTDWLAPDTRKRLRAYGVAPPDALACPQCGSTDIQLISEFGSTACKSLHRCMACLEPFDHFKAL